MTEPDNPGLVVGDDGLARPAWATSDPLLREYYDTERGMPVRDERRVFERLSLEAFQSGLIVPHYDAAPAYNTVMEPGMVFTIEPMLTLGTVEWEQWEDNWTIVTADRSRTAQFEHTIVVTEDGAEILTLP